LLDLAAVHHQLSEQVVQLPIRIEGLVRHLGQPRGFTRAAGTRTRTEAAARLGAWCWPPLTVTTTAPFTVTT